VLTAQSFTAMHPAGSGTFWTRGNNCVEEQTSRHSIFSHTPVVAASPIPVNSLTPHSTTTKIASKTPDIIYSNTAPRQLATPKKRFTNPLSMDVETNADAAAGAMRHLEDQSCSAAPLEEEEKDPQNLNEGEEEELSTVGDVETGEEVPKKRRKRRPPAVPWKVRQSAFA
jgi:hypothetical protein